MYTYSSTTTRAVGSRTILLALSLAAWGGAGAQDPVRLPGVKVKATVPLPGPRLLTGIVVDTSGITLGGVEITIPELQRRLLSQDDGTFRFDSVPRGTFAMRARKIGYAAQVRAFSVDTGGGVAEFQLLPLARALPAVVSSASRGGLSGVIGDTAFNAIPGATVRILSAGIETKTDSLGAFWLPVKAGSYMVSIAKDSFATRLVGVSIPSDSGRRMTAWLQSSHGPVPKDQVWNIADLSERRAWTLKGAGNTFYTREQLLKMGIVWIYDAVKMTAATNQAKEAYSPDCFVLVNGGPATANLSTLTVDDVESVEVYPSFHGVASTTAAAQPRGKNSKVKGPKNQFVSGQNARFAEFENRTRSCPGVYVWLR